MPIIDDSNFKGGYKVVGTVAERDAIPAVFKKAGMLVWCQETGVIYRLGTDFTWAVHEDNRRNWFMSGRDFTAGTLILSNINYNVSEGEPWLLEIKANTYGNLVPMAFMLQGYIYANTVINVGGLSTGFTPTGLISFNYQGHLCFWFPRQSYWQGFTVYLSVSYPGNFDNRCVAVYDSAKPTPITKEYSHDAGIRQVLRSDNWSTYAAPASLTQRVTNLESGPTRLSGSKLSGASGTWTDLFFCSHTHAAKIFIMARSDTNHVATSSVDTSSAYGATVSANISSKSVIGGVSNIAVQYNNVGYKIQAAITYSTPTAPTIYWSAEGIGESAWYAL